MGIGGGDDKSFFASGGNAGKGALTPLTKIRRTLVTAARDRQDRINR